MIIRTFTLIGIVLLSTGCASMGTSSAPSDVSIDAGEGLHYYLPTAALTFEVTAGKATFDPEKGVDLIADPTRMLVFQYAESVMHDDTVEVKISKGGLLSSVKTTSKDQSAGIILKVAELAKAAAKLSFVVGGEQRMDGDVTRQSFTQKELLEGKRMIGGASVQLETMTDTAGVTVECKGALCYRPLVPHRLVITATGAPPRSYFVLLPDLQRVVSLSLKRASFVEKSVSMTFEDGTLTALEIKKPSQFLGLVSLPVDFVKALVSIPAELIQLKIDTTKSDTSYLEQQKVLLEMQKLLDEARKPEPKDGDGTDPTKQ